MAGRRRATKTPVEDLPLDQILELAEENDTALPCGNWSPDDKDSTLVQELNPEDKPSPDYREPEPNPDRRPRP
jgi:hypothetical protein